MSQLRHPFKTIPILLFACLTVLAGCREPVLEMPIEEKIGQMLMVGVRGVEIDRFDPVFKDIETYNVGGIILFDKEETADFPLRNMYSRFQLKAFTDSLKNLTKTPPFIALNMEGGAMSPLRPQFGFPRSLPAAHIGRVNHPDSTKNYAVINSKSMQVAGFNLNFAPVADLNLDPENKLIGQQNRSYSADPNVVTFHTGMVQQVQKQYGIVSVFKHFPGQGSGWNESHLGMPNLTGSWQNIELIPYREAIRANTLEAVMMGNFFQFDLDGEYPASLSYDMITGLLRNQMRFDGVVFTGDLHLEAMMRYYPFDEVIRLAIMAGADVLVFSNNVVRYERDIVARTVKTILDLIELGVIDTKRIDESYERVMKLKRAYGLTELSDGLP